MWIPAGNVKRPQSLAEVGIVGQEKGRPIAADEFIHGADDNKREEQGSGQNDRDAERVAAPVADDPDQSGWNLVNLAKMRRNAGNLAPRARLVDRHGTRLGRILHDRRRHGSATPNYRNPA